MITRSGYCLFVMNEEVSKRVPLVRIVVQVSHRGLKRWLKHMNVVFEEPEYNGPNHRPEYREREERAAFTPR